MNVLRYMVRIMLYYSEAYRFVGPCNPLYYAIALNLVVYTVFLLRSVVGFCGRNEQ